jgi:hypothetical protein
MPHRRSDWHERIKAVEREFWSARRAIDRLSSDVARDTSALGKGPSPRDLRSADENLEGTYLIRMFAEFETGVRTYWRAMRPRARTQAQVLLDRVGDTRGMSADVIDDVHAARLYRNNLLHHREETAEVVTISQARACFQKYLSRLPNEWVD